MIRRLRANHFLLIAQHDHALLSGQLAGHIGGIFTLPVPRAEVLLACSQHDAGWPLHDDRPTLNAEGLPLDVFETPLPLALSLWPAAAERVSAQSQYAALLVHLHALALSAFAATHPHTQREIFELNKFQHRQIEQLEKLRAHLGLRTDLPLRLGLAAPGAGGPDDQLTYDFGLLQLVDRISLNLCCTEIVFPQLNDVRPGPGKPPITLHMRATGDTVFTLSPWPFDQSELLLDVPYRAVPADPCNDVEYLRRAYALAPLRQMRVCLRA